MLWMFMVGYSVKVTFLDTGAASGTSRNVLCVHAVLCLSVSLFSFFLLCCRPIRYHPPALPHAHR